MGYFKLLKGGAKGALFGRTEEPPAPSINIHILNLIYFEPGLKTWKLRCSKRNVSYTSEIFSAKIREMWPEKKRKKHSNPDNKKKGTHTQRKTPPLNSQ